MFDSLKKRLKEALGKASATILKKEEVKEGYEDTKVETQPEPIAEEEKKAEVIAPVLPEEKKEEARKEISAETKPLMQTPAAEETEQPQQKKSLLHGLIKRVVEKKLSEGDVEPIIRNLRKALLESDVALETAEQICDDVKENLIGRDVSRGRAEETIKDALRLAMLDVMKQEEMDLEVGMRNKSGPYLIMFLGFNGTGKTTTMAKFAHRYKKYNPILAAGDTFRAASIEQLEEHASRLGVEIVKHKYGADSAAVIFDAVKHAAAKGGRLVLADTAGRSHSNVNLMDELKKVVRVNKPDLKILVLDSLTGNDIYDQSRLFNEAVGVDAIVLTKADVYEKGGAALSAAHTIKKPVLFLGTGQRYDDLKEFNAEEIVENLLK